MEKSASAWHILSIWLDLKVIPQIFSGIQVWALRLLKDFHILVVKPLQCWFGSMFESCWSRDGWPHSQAFGTCSLFEICLFGFPHCSSGPLGKSPWPSLIMLRGMDGVRGLISSARFTDTLCITADFLWIFFHQISESFASCSVFHTSFVKLQASAMCCFSGEADFWNLWRAVLTVSVLAKLLYYNEKKKITDLSEWVWDPWQLSWQFVLFGQRPDLRRVLVITF